MDQLPGAPWLILILANCETLKSCSIFSILNMLFVRQLDKTANDISASKHSISASATRKKKKKEKINTNCMTFSASYTVYNTNYAITQIGF